MCRRVPRFWSVPVLVPGSWPVASLRGPRPLFLLVLLLVLLLFVFAFRPPFSGLRSSSPFSLFYSLSSCSSSSLSGLRSPVCGLLPPSPCPTPCPPALRLRFQASVLRSAVFFPLLLVLLLVFLLFVFASRPPQRTAANSASASPNRPCSRPTLELGEPGEQPKTVRDRNDSQETKTVSIART